MEQTPNPSVFDELAEQQPYFQYATQGQRLGNLVVDMVVYYIFNYCLAYTIGILLVVAGYDQEKILAVFSNKIVAYSFASLNMVIIYTLLEGVTKGRTLGKIITGTVAVKEDLSPITWKEAVKRSASRIVPFEQLSALGNTPWHDKWSKTMVIKKRQTI